jgi:hypothetical protein
VARRVSRCTVNLDPAGHNLAVTGSNPIPSTCFDGSETRLPQGYTKAGVQRRRPFRVPGPVPATSSGHGASLEAMLSAHRARRPARQFVSLVAPFSTKTLGCLCVSRRLGLRLSIALNRSETLGLASDSVAPSRWLPKLIDLLCVAPHFLMPLELDLSEHSWVRRGGHVVAGLFAVASTIGRNPCTMRPGRASSFARLATLECRRPVTINGAFHGESILSEDMRVDLRRAHVLVPE